MARARPSRNARGERRQLRADLPGCLDRCVWAGWTVMSGSASIGIAVVEPAGPEVLAARCRDFQQARRGSPDKCVLFGREMAW